jgi:serine/threonine protein kinase
MAYVHSKGVCHRDLKPENVFLDHNLEPKIADFGFAKFTPAEFQMSAEMGTPQFMAPELFNDGGFSSLAIDVYAYAVTVLALVARGDLHFESANPKNWNEIARLVKAQQRFVIPADCDPAIRDLIQICWSHQPVHRPRFSEIVAKIDREQICIPGTNMAKYKAYREKILNWTAPVVEDADDEFEQTNAFPFH